MLTWQAVQVAAFLMSFQISSTKLLASIALLNSSISRGERLLSSRETAPRATEPRANSVSVKLGRIVNHEFQAWLLEDDLQGPGTRHLAGHFIVYIEIQV